MQVTDLYLKEAISLTTSDTEKEEHKFKKLKAKELQTFAADYWNEVGSYSRKIYVKNDTLMYFRGEGNESPLVPISTDMFQMMNVGADLKVRFENEDNGQTMIVTIDDGDPIVSKSYVPASYSEEELKEFTGTFFSEELSTSYTFVLNEGKLIASHSRLSDINITPIKQDMFSGNRWFFSNINYERDANNMITGMRVSSGRVRNLYFEKTAHNIK